MNDAVPARIGTLAGVVVLLLVALPYAVTDGSEVSVYYGVGVVGPPLLSLFVAVAAVALLSGAAGRSDPATVAGVALVLGVAVAGFAALWALEAGSVVGGMTTSATFDYHRWALLAAATVLAAAAAWYARLAV